jgi:hypothetical protein
VLKLGGLAVALGLATVAFFAFFRPSLAVTANPADYTFVGTVGNVASTYQNPGDLVNPTMVSYLTSQNLVYIYNDSSGMPGADANTYREISVFKDNLDGTFTYQGLVLVNVNTTYNFPNSKPQGMTTGVIGGSNIVLLTAPNGALVNMYDGTAGSNSPLPTALAIPNSHWTGNAVGVPSVDQTTGNILVGGQFQDGTTGNTYGIALINMAAFTGGSGNPQTDTPKFYMRTNGQSNGDSYTVQNVVAAPNGDWYASGYFQISGKTYNVVKINSATAAITPVAPPNVTGLNVSDSAAIYTITSINVDGSNNIYLSGSFGVTLSGQYNSAALIKLDQNGNFVTMIAPETNTSTTTGSLGNLNMVSINTQNQWVFATDSSNASGHNVKVFAFNGTLPGSGNQTPQPSTPPSNSNVDTSTGAIVVTPPDDCTTTITNQDQAGYNNNELPATVIVLTPTFGNTTSINTSTLNPDTNTSITASTAIDTATGSVTVATTTPDGSTTTGSGTATTNADGSTTTVVTINSPDGTATASTTTITSNVNGGTTTTNTITTTDPSNNTSSSTIIITTDGSGNTDVTVKLPDITTGNSYTTVLTCNNGSGSSDATIIPWTAGDPEPSIALTEVYCSDTSFDITITPTPDGTLGTDCATIITTTNNPTGYGTTLNASTDNLVCNASSGTYNLTPAASSPTDLGSNQWGYNLDTATPTQFAAVPTSPLTIQSNTVATAGDRVKLWIGAKLDLTQPACTYTGQITVTASANPVPAPTITGVSPNTDAPTGGKVVTITGTNFGTATNPYLTEIGIGNVTCTFFAVVDNNTATCTTPPNAAGAYDVKVNGYGGLAALGNGFTYKVPVATTCYSTDPTTANIQIDRDPNMIPVYYNNATDAAGYASWTIAGNTNWCAYTNKQWANAVTLNNTTVKYNTSGGTTSPTLTALQYFRDYATVGTNIPEADVLGYWVYIPRFAYEVQRYYAFNAPVAANNFSINFEKSTTTKKVPAAPSNGTTANALCYTAPTSTSFTGLDYRTACGISRTYGAATGTTWGTHPAFTMGATELNGFWMAKFETSGSRTAPQIKPNQVTNISESIGTFYDMGKSMGVLDSSNTGGSGTSIPQNNHNLNTFNSNMTNNSQWGAAAYLTASAYGAGYNGVQPNLIIDTINTASTDQDGQGGGGSVINTLTLVGRTGCGPQSSGSTGTYGSSITLNQTTLQSPYACGTSTTDATHGYAGTIGLLASTTNNIYGVYDMSAGAYDYVAANYNNVTNGAITTMFTVPFGSIYSSTPFGTRPAWSSSSDQTYFGYDACNWTLCGGQANYETTTVQSVTGDSGWNGSYSRFLLSSSNYEYAIRGGCACNSATYDGIFSQSNAAGAAQGYMGFRAMLYP